MRFPVMTAALLVAVASPAALAQNGARAPASTQASSNATGPERAPVKETASGAGLRNPDPEAAANQPFMATGEDLKGAPTQFPAVATPE